MACAFRAATTTVTDGHVEPFVVNAAKCYHAGSQRPGPQTVQWPGRVSRGTRMCGIAGIWHFDGRPVDRDGLARATSAVSHRGPDDQGVFIDGAVGLGHRRLSIIDTSDAGHQPISNEDGSIWLTYNGEVYNFAELRPELEAKGHHFRSRTDSEVIVHAYEEWGVDAVTRFNGMFAFALWDRRTRRMWLVRDRLGVKPLFYYDDGRTLAFGSELKAILAHGAVQRDLDPTALADYLSLNHVPAPRTPFRHIRVLPPAHMLSASGAGAQPTSYWDVSFGEPDTTRSAAAFSEEIRTLVDDAVARRRIADVPLGAFLSGGIDSSAIVHVLNRYAAKPLQTFSVRFGDPSHDEGPFALQVARAEGTAHHEIVCEPRHFREHLDTMMYHADNLTADVSMIPMYLLAGLARQHVTVVLSGDGGDEVFGGYPTYFADRAAMWFRALPTVAQRACAGLVEWLPSSDDKMSLEFVARKFVNGAALSVPNAHASWRGIFAHEERLALLASGSALGVREAALAGVSPRAQPEGPSASGGGLVAYYNRAAGSPLERLFYADLKTYLPDSILPKVDTMTMAHGLEAREPLLDYRLVELGARIPLRYKLRGRHTKWIFKQAMRPHLLPAIVARPKAGFQPPMAGWFRKELRSFVEERLAASEVRGLDWIDHAAVERIVSEHVGGVANHAYKLWSLMSLLSWHRRWARGGEAS